MATAKITLSISATSPTYTTRKVTVKLYYHGNGVSFNNDARPWKISATGQDSVSGKDTFTTSTSEQLLGSTSFTWTRGRSDTTKTISATYSTDTSLGTLKCSTTVTIPAKPSYTVKYDANGGTGAPSSQTKYYGETLTLRTTKPTRTGYTFKDWESIRNDGTYHLDPGGTTSYNGSQTLVARWTINKYKVTYKNVDNKGDTTEKTGINYGSSYTLITPKAVTGYKFTGWKNNSSGTIYKAGATVTVKSNLSYTAQWELTTTQFKVGDKTISQTFKSVVSTALTKAFSDYAKAFNKHDMTLEGLINSSSNEKLTDAKGNLISSSLFYKDSNGDWRYKGTLSNVTVVYSYRQNEHTIRFYYLNSNGQPEYFKHIGVQGTEVRFTAILPNIGSYKFSGYYKAISSIPKGKDDFTFIDTYTTPTLLSQNGFVSSVVISDKDQTFAAVYIPVRSNNTVYTMSSWARTSYNNAQSFVNEDDNRLYINNDGSISDAIIEDNGTYICGYIKYKSNYSNSTKGLHDIKYNILNPSNFKGIRQGNINININGNPLKYKIVFIDTDVYIKFSTTTEYPINKSYYIDCQITDAINDLDYPISPTILALFVPGTKIVIDVNKDKSVICFGEEARDDESEDMVLFKLPIVFRGDDKTPSYTNYILSIDTDISNIKTGTYFVVEDDIKIFKDSLDNSINLNKGDIVTIINSTYISIKIDRSDKIIIYKSFKL